MTSDTDGPRAAADQHLDRVARALHAQAVGHVPGRTLRQLRARRAPAAPARTRSMRTPMRTFGWAAAAACAAVFAVAIGLRQQPVAPTGPPAVAAVDAPASGDDAPASDNDAYADALASLDENPDLYLWLASSDAQPLAME